MVKLPKREGRSPQLIEHHNFQSLFDALKEKHYRLIGPTVRDGSVVYDEIDRVDDLPVGFSDDQEKGTYRLRNSGDQRLFGFGVGLHSWKKFLSPPVVRLWQARRDNGSFHINPEEYDVSPLAFIGVRACELNAIAIQDRVFLEGEYRDPIYAAQREQLFILAVNCSQAANTCFCASMRAGPRVTGQFDLALTEVKDEEHHYFTVEVGSALGEDVLSVVPHRPATAEERAVATEVIARTTASMKRSIDTRGIKQRLYASYEHPHWDDVAARCLACGNCTQVCPTCFCTNVEDITNLTGSTAERWRKWDSCFTTDFSYIVGGSIRSSVKSRYRQWMTHKLATWIDQFGMSGCVGCGRCITWCPVGIDITEEMAAIRAEPQPAVDPAVVKEEAHENA
jgi:ferredoxin